MDQWKLKYYELKERCEKEQDRMRRDLMDKCEMEKSMLNKKLEKMKAFLKESESTFNKEIGNLESQHKKQVQCLRDEQRQRLQEQEEKHCKWIEQIEKNYKQQLEQKDRLWEEKMHASRKDESQSSDCSEIKLKLMKDNVDRIRLREAMLQKELEEEKRHLSLQQDQYEIQLSDKQQEINQLQLKLKEQQMKSNRNTLEIEELKGTHSLPTPLAKLDLLNFQFEDKTKAYEEISKSMQNASFLSINNSFLNLDHKNVQKSFEVSSHYVRSAQKKKSTKGKLSDREKKINLKEQIQSVVHLDTRTSKRYACDDDRF